MKGVKIPILNEEGLSISLKGSHNGKILGYYINSRFFKKKESNLFISELKKILSSDKFKNIMSKIEEIEKRHKKRQKTES